MDDFRIKSSDPDAMARTYADMIDPKMEWHPPVAPTRELPSLTLEQQDKLTADIAELIHNADFAKLDVSAMPVTTAPVDDGKLHFKKQSDPGY